MNYEIHTQEAVNGGPETTKNGGRNQSFFYGWVIVACVFVFAFVNYGLRNSFSVFYVAILNEFNWSRADTAFIFSLSTLLYGLMAPVSGKLADKFGPRKVIPIGAMLSMIGMLGFAMARELWQFYLFFGVLLAIGNSTAGFTQYLPLVARWFMSNRVKAIGIVMAGIGVSFFFSFPAEYMINLFGWRTASLIAAIIPPAVIIPLDLIFVRRPEEMETPPKRNGKAVINKMEETSKSVTLNKALKSSSFWLIFISNILIWGIGLNMLLAHTVAFMRNIGFDAVFSALIFSSHGIFTAVGNTFSFTLEKFSKAKAFIAGSFCVISAVFLLSTATIYSAWKLYAWLVLYGIGFGIIGPALGDMTVDLFKGEHLGSINGCLMLGFGIGGCLGPYIGGYIFDLTNTYTLAFYLAITAISVSSVLMWMVTYLNKMT